MPEITIQTVADLRRALAIPSVIVFVDRHDALAPTIQRDPGRMAAAMRPRTVRAVRSADVVFEVGGKPLYSDIPKAANLIASGTNTYEIIRPADDNNPETRIGYRLEMPGTPGASIPSRLIENHPPLPAEILVDEAIHRATAAVAEDRRVEAHKAAFNRVKAIPNPPEDPRHATLANAMKLAIETALQRGVYYEDALAADVAAKVVEEEYAVLSRLPDITIGRLDQPAAPYVLLEEASAALSHHPRGTWQMFIEIWPNNAGKCSTLIISSGASARAYNCQSNLYTTGEDALAQMKSREVYDLRQLIAREQEAAKRADAQQRRNFQAGQVFKKLRINSVEFATATIGSIEPTTNAISLILRKRGSARTYTCVLSAAELDRAKPEADTAAAPLLATGRAQAGLC